MVVEVKLVGATGHAARFELDDEEFAIQWRLILNQAQVERACNKVNRTEQARLCRIEISLDTLRRTLNGEYVYPEPPR